MVRVWSEDQYDWFYTSDGYLYYAPRRDRRSVLTVAQRRLAWLLTFLLALTVGFEAAAVTVVIVLALAGGV